MENAPLVFFHEYQGETSSSVRPPGVLPWALGWKNEGRTRESNLCAFTASRTPMNLDPYNAIQWWLRPRPLSPVAVRRRTLSNATRRALERREGEDNVRPAGGGARDVAGVHECITAVLFIALH